MLLACDRSCLLIVDAQERLMPAMADANMVIDNAIVLIRAAQRLNVPILLSRQYPKGLGDTVEPIREAVGDSRIFDKIEFSCFANQEMRKAMQELGRDQFVVAGVEAHVCVLQTAMDLAGEGYQVAIVNDATSSRRQESQDVAMLRMAKDGIDPVTTEMVLFEWLREAGGEEFKELSSLIR
jgi:nicotinamidase-related amidase